MPSITSVSRLTLRLQNPSLVDPTRIRNAWSQYCFSGPPSPNQREKAVVIIGTYAIGNTPTMSTATIGSTVRKTFATG